MLTLPPGTENTVFPPRPPFLAHGGNPRVESERGLEVKGVVSVDRPTQSVYDPIHSRRKSADKSAIESDRCKFYSFIFLNFGFSIKGLKVNELVD